MYASSCDCGEKRYPAGANEEAWRRMLDLEAIVLILLLLEDDELQSHIILKVNIIRLSFC